MNAAYRLKVLSKEETRLAIDGLSLTPGPGWVTSAPDNYGSVVVSRIEPYSPTNYHRRCLVEPIVYLADGMGINAAQFDVNPVQN